MTQPRTALTAPINPVTPRSEVVEALAIAAVGGMLIGMSRRNSRTGTLARIAGLAMIGVAARPCRARPRRGAEGLHDDLQRRAE